MGPQQDDKSTATNEWFQKQGPQAPLAWYGGKSNLARWIISHFVDHRIYIEPFGGMANVLFKKVPSQSEILNDRDGRVVNFFQVIRDPQSLAELKRLAELTPYSREVFAALCEQPEPQEPIERAYWFFVRCRQARGGIGMSKLTPNAWATSRRTRREMPEPISKYLSAIDGLDRVADRLRRVVIERDDAIEIIRKHNVPDALFYCDPPYPAETRSGGKAATYGVEMTTEEHRDLLSALRDCKGRVLISNYSSPMYEEALQGWTRHERKTHVQFSNSSGCRTEVLWCNYQVEEQNHDESD